MRSRRARVEIPRGISAVAVHAPNCVDTGKLTLGISSDPGGVDVCAWGVPVPLGRASVIEFKLMPSSLADLWQVRRPSLQPWAPVRRTIAIARDRLLPIFKGPAES